MDRGVLHPRLSLSNLYHWIYNWPSALRPVQAAWPADSGTKIAKDLIDALKPVLCDFLLPAEARVPTPYRLGGYRTCQASTP